eukprot:6393-Heterococcus_DN1.PRE.4
MQELALTAVGAAVGASVALASPLAKSSGVQMRPSTARAFDTMHSPSSVSRGSSAHDTGKPEKY